MTKTKRIILICICSLLIVATMVAMIFAAINFYGGKNNAHAEYADLAGTNTLVNFNQIFNFGNVNRNDNGVTWVTSNNNPLVILTINSRNNDMYTFNSGYITFVEGHSYYFKSSNPNVKVYAFGSAHNNNISVANSSQDLGLIVNDVYENGTVLNVYINIIDLTVMFGENNIPNEQQAQEYFTAEYYNYTTGTQVPYSKDYLQGYQDGANDLLDAMTITYNAFTIGASSTTYANNIIERGELVFSQTEGYYYFSGVIGISLNSIVERGTTFDVDYQFLIPDFIGESQSYKLSFNLHFAYVDDNNNLIDIVEITPTNEGNYNSYNGSFVLPISTSKIFCYVNDGVVGQDNQASLQCFAFKSDLTFKSTDVALLMTNAYQRGYSDMQERYNMNGDLYNEIWTLGYNNGLAQQNATIGTMDYAKAAFIGIGEILKIELLPGVPFSLFVLLPLMLGLITFVVKLSKGGD